jgi:esterase/lipase
VDKKLPEIREDETEQEMFDSESSESFNSDNESLNKEPAIEYNNNLFNNNEDRNFTQLNNEEKNEFKKLKMINDFQNKTMTEKYKNSTEQIGITTEKKEKVPSLDELKDMNLDEIPFHMLDEQTQRLKRMEKYAEILAIKKMGITLTKSYDISSDYDEMCFEVKFWKDYQCKKDGVEMAKGFLVNAVQGLEFLNESYDPFGLKLGGWSEQVELGKDSYTSVFEDLYDKYKISGRKIQPEIKLVLMMSASAASFHASKKMAESIPGLDNVLSNNPELLSKLQSGINNNISSQGNTVETEEDKQKKMYEQMQKIKEQQNKIEQLKKQQESVSNNTEKIKEQMSMLNTNKTEDVKPDISNILNKIKAQNAARKADEVLNNQLSDSSEKESEVTESIVTGESETKKKRGRKPKTSISINT